MTIQTDNASATLPHYLFRLESSLGNVNLTTFPLEWEDGVLEINRRLDAGGVFSMFNVESLTFIKEGAYLLKKIWAQYEMLGKCTLKIKYLKKSTLNYVEFPTSYALKFISYKIVKVGNTAIGVNINAEHLGALDKFDKRKGTDLDVTRTTSIDGFKISDYADLLKRLQILAIDASKTGSFSQSAVQNYASVTPGTYYVYFPMTITNSDYSETHTIALTATGALNKLYGLFYESLEARTVLVTGTLAIDLTTITGGFSVIGVNMDVLNAASASQHNYNLVNYDDSTPAGDKSIPINQSVVLDVDETIVIYAVVVVDNPGAIDFDIDSTAVEIVEGITSSPAKTVDSYPIYETGERLAQLMMGTQYPFYSEYLGRLDTPYNLAGDFYAAENQLRFMSFLSGLHIRGELLSNENAPLILSWDKWFQAVNSFYNLGYTFETIDSFLRIRVEEYAFFYDDTEVLDLTSRISVYDIESEAMPELAYLNIKSGYKKFEASELIYGRGEYCTLSTRTSIADSDAEFDNVSDIRGDTQGIAALINTPTTTDGTVDEKGDEDIFVIKTQRNTADADIDWDGEQEENVTADNNTSLFGSSGLNMYLTPARMLKRQGSRLKIALTKELSSNLSFQTMEKSQTLETTGEGYTIIENDDILVNDLTAPIVRPMKHRVEVMLTWADIETILANPLQRITFSSSITGWILNIKKKNNEDKGVIEIIEKYVS